jgi:hypothetical protein
VIVTLAEEMPVTEGLELMAALREKLDREPEMVVANGLYPPLGSKAAARRSDPATALWRDRRRLNDRELERLAGVWVGPLAEIPLFALDRGPALTTAVAERLAQA